MVVEIRRKRRREVGTRNLVTNNHHPKAPPWIEKLRVGELHLEPEDALPMYNIYVMMRLRNISRADVAKKLGLTKQRVQAMMMEGGESHARIESAITAITDERHQGHCEDRACAVYKAAGVDDLQAGKMAEAFRQEKKDYPDLWRLDNG